MLLPQGHWNLQVTLVLPNFFSRVSNALPQEYTGYIPVIGPKTAKNRPNYDLWRKKNLGEKDILIRVQ
jgi:hypothetical protein